MAVSYGKKAKEKATRLHSKIVRSRGRCERCGESDYSKLQCAHIIRRTYSATRTMPEASWALCYRCHWLTEKEPDEFMKLVDSTIGLPRFYELKQLALDGVGKKVDWEAEVKRLQQLVEELAA